MITYYWVVLGIVALSGSAMTEYGQATGTRRIENRQPRFRNKRSMDKRFINNATVYYTIDSRFSSSQKNYIMDKINRFNKLSCVQWLPSVPGKPLSAKFLPNYNSGCFTYQHSTYNASEINLSEHCFDDGWVMHEMGHALGFQHEQKRRDRNCYLEIDPSLAKTGDYEISPYIDRSFPYDWTSYMHYRKGTDFKLRREFYDHQQDQLGQYEQLSKMDVIKLKYYYCGGPHYCTTYPDECKRRKDFVEKNYCSF
ncbi:hatching enzyme 1.2-like [Homalodisca vitripennis]|uniref:hatching enzyme 1.2-like n=2 Tax=Homalodisca vitripennis TaxID=197043 RepID=UPI001EEBA7F8|nr:hatching enzyme 1.2-like [Homalodisca vitripennis]